MQKGLILCNIMDKRISNNQINKMPFILQPSNNDNNNSYHKICQPIAIEIRDNENNAFDYNNIPLTLTGEISSSRIYRHNVMQKRDDHIVENIEDDDEQFFLNLKKDIDNHKIQNKENYGIKDLQSRSYLSRKKKSAFSDEDQNLIKRFKKCIDEKTPLCAEAPVQKLQISENITINHNPMKPSTSQITPAITFNNIDVNLRNNTNQPVFQITFRMRRDDEFLTSEKTKIITETEIEELIYYEFQCVTPPQENY